MTFDINFEVFYLLSNIYNPILLIFNDTEMTR